jgi:hypothetical protein
MANIRFQTEIESLNGIKYKVQIYDSLYTGSPSDFSLGSAPIIKFDSAGSEKFNEILASKCELEFVLETNNQVTFWESSFRSDTYTERDVYVFIYQYTDSYKLMWTGYILQDLSTTEDVALPKSILLQAVDGLSVLKEIPFVPNALSAGTSPFTESQTYIPAGTTPTNADSSWGSGGYHRMSFWIAEVLGYAGTASSSLTNASISDYEISISANWYNSKMDATEIQTNDSFFLTAINARQFYKANEASGSNDDVNYNAMSCYDALRNMLRCFGARIFYWGHKFYIIQIGLYSTLETGTDASPVNIKTQIYNKAGVKQSSNSLVGNNNITRYSLTTTSSRPNTPGGLKKLSGTTYDDFPVYKKAMTSFTSVSNLNLFNSFVLIPGQTNNPPSMVGGFTSGNQIAAIDTAFENIGTFTDAKDFTGFFLNIFVKFKNGSGSGNVYMRNNWTIQAKPSSTSSWDTSATLVPVVLVNNTTNAITLEWHEAINFSTFNANTQSLQFRNTYGKASEVPSGHTAKNPFSSKIPVNLGTTVRSVVQDTSIADNFNYVLPTASVMSGDWDFRFFAAVHARPETNLGLKYRHRGHGVQNFNPTSSFGRPPFAASAVPTLLAPNGDGGDISYQVMASNNSYQSAFAVVSGGQIGAYASHTNVTLNTNASYVKQVPDTLWGDTLNTNAPGSLYVDTGSAFEFTNFTGQWGKGVLNGSDSLTELLLKEVLFHNTLKTYKGNFTFSLSNTNRNLSNNSQYPKQISPLTIIKDIDFSNRKFVMLNGGWNLITNEVSGSWFEYKYDSQTTTVRSIDTGIGGTVNTGGGGSIGVGNNDPIDIGTGTGFTPPSPSNLVSSGFINTTSSSVGARLSGNVTDANDGSVLLRSRFGREPFTTTTGVITSGSAVTTIPIDGTLVQADTFKQGDVLIIVDSETEHKFTIATDVAEGATSLTVSSTTLDEDIPPGAFIYPDPDDLYVQYQHKSRGSIGNFAVTSTGMQSGSVNITSYIDDDSFGTASANSLATSESIKAYVDGQAGLSENLQTVTDNGNTTTNSITIGSSSSPEEKLSVNGNIQLGNQKHLTWSDIGDGNTLRVSIKGDEDNDFIAFRTDNSERMRLTNTGLGIGTTSPYATLTVAGNITQTSNGYLISTRKLSARDGNGLDLVNDGGEGISIKDNNNVIITNGNLGIGNTSPASILSLASATPIITSDASDNTVAHGIEFKNSGTLDAYIKQKPSTGEFEFNVGRSSTWGGDFLFTTDTYEAYRIARDLHRWYIAGSEKMRLNSTGVGIGTTSPSEKLDVVGNVKIRGTNNLTIGSTSDGGDFSLSSGIRGYKFANNNGELLRITSDGNVLIGTTSDSGSKLQVVKASDVKIEAKATTAGAFFKANSVGNGYFGMELFNDSTAKWFVGTYADNSGISANDFAIVSGSKVNGDVRFKINSSGNVTFTGDITGQSITLGDGSTDEKLRVYYNDNSYVDLHGYGLWFSRSHSYIRPVTNNDTVFHIGSATSNFSGVFNRATTHYWYNGATEKMRLSSSGGLSIGTSSGGYKLLVSGTGWGGQGIGIQSTTTNGAVLTLANTQRNFQLASRGNSFSIRDITDSDTERLNISASGVATFYGNVKITDNNTLIIGSGSDLRLTHDSTNSLIQNFGGDLVIEQRVDDKDIILKSDDGSGGTTTYLTLDGSAGYTVAYKAIRFNDSVTARFGTGSDCTIQHDGTDTYLNNNTGNLVLTNLADDKDIIFKSDNGSGGTSAYLTLDGSAGYTTVQKKILFEDSVVAGFGNSTDLYISYNGSYGSIMNENGDLYISNNSDNGDIIFRSDNGSGGLAEYFRLNGGFSSPYTNFPDNSTLSFGGSNDLRIYHDGTNNNINSVNGELKIAQYTDDSDIVFYSDNGTGGLAEYIRLDGSQTTVNVSQNLLINTTTDVGVPLYVNGVIRAVGGGIQAAQDYGFTLNDESGSNRYGLKFGAAGTVGGSNLLMLTNRSFNSATGGGEVAIGGNTNTSGVTEVEIARFKPRVAATSGTQKKVSLDAVLELTAQTTPADPASGKSVIWMDSGGDIKVKINVAGTTVTRTIAAYE